MNGPTVPLPTVEESGGFNARSVGLEKRLNAVQANRIKSLFLMKLRLWPTGIVTLIVALSLAGCGREQQAVAASTNAPTGDVDRLKEQSKNAITTTKDYLGQQKDRWQKRYEDKLSQFDKQLADLKAKSYATGDKAKSEWGRALAQLEQKKKSAAQKFEQFKNASADKWQKLKTKTETAFADFEKSFKDAVSRFTNDDKSAKPSH